ncbi:MAG: tRNA uridine-5-carboxymethylaminomethyl(34) synthesis GTPase MnmE [Mucinivorans sp.]
MSTIVALSSPTGGAIALVRLSGSDAYKIVRQLFDRDMEPRLATFGHIVSPTDHAVIDEVVCTYFAQPASYTGEDMVEISCHGSSWIAGEIMRLLCEQGGVMATAGEFSRRAFLNGKLDLSQAEAVADLIASTSAAAARVAMSQMRGGYRDELRELRAKLLHIKSMLELEMDFGEEQVEFASRTELAALLSQVLDKIGHLTASFASGNAIKNGVAVAIIGEPNVGKSTLLNALAGDDRAIVSAEAGTTRDYIESQVTIGGVLFRFIDTAGLRNGLSAIESEGIRRSREQARLSAIVVRLTDENGNCSDQDNDYKDLIVVHSKCDQYTMRQSGERYLSVLTGEGLDSLRDELVARSGAAAVERGEVLVSNARHYDCLQRAFMSLREASVELSAGSPTDKICSSMSDGLSHIAQITGEITSDEVLRNIFSTFCIGK